MLLIGWVERRAHHNGPVRIALADDEADLRIAMSRLLVRLGHHVVGSAPNGAELLVLCGENEVDVAMVDLEMPEMDGLAAAEELSQRASR